MAQKCPFVLSDCLEFGYHTVRNQTMRLMLFCPIVVPGVIKAWMALSDNLSTRQSCKVSTKHIPTFGQYNLSPRFTVFALHAFPSLHFHVEFLFHL